MSPIEITALLALIGFAIYRQSRRHEIVGATRFKLPLVYAVVGVVVGGFALPHTLPAVLLVVGSLVLSVLVGVARGRLTPVWSEGGRVFAHGTPVTIGLFLGLVAVKCAIGTVCWFLHIPDGGGLGEILLMIAAMLAFQTEIVWRRARAMTAAMTTSVPEAAPVAG
jgi:hypothetical protein